MERFLSEEDVLEYLSTSNSFAFDKIDAFYFVEERFEKIHTADDIFEWIFKKNDNVFAILGLGKDRVPYFRIGSIEQVLSPKEKTERCNSALLTSMAKEYADKHLFSAKKKKHKKIPTPF